MLRQKNTSARSIALNIFDLNALGLLKSSCCIVIKHYNFVFCSRIRDIVESFGSHLHVELQQRGVEFSQLFVKYDQMRPALLERMPPMETVRHSETTQDLTINGGDESPPSPKIHLPDSHSVSHYFIVELNQDGTSIVGVSGAR